MTVEFSPATPFAPAPGLAAPHTQTLFAHFARPRHRPAMVREVIDTPDGDRLHLDVLAAPSEAPWLLILHGLEGHSRTGYVSAMLRGAHARGFGAVALNFRSCGGEPNQTPRFYHSGETGDPRLVLEWLRQRVSGPLLAVGFSLGGNVLVRLLGEEGGDCGLSAAAAVSVPYDLDRACTAIDGPGLGVGLYRMRFLRTLKAKALAKAAAFPGALDAARVRAIRDLRGFDDVVTGPLHGFADAADYYARASSGPVVERIRVPTLLLSAEDDPMVPADTLPPVDANPRVTVVRTARGGHVGFVAGTLWRPRFWGDEVVLDFLEQAVSGAGAGVDAA